MKEKIYLAVIILALACASFGCGNKDNADNVLQEDITTFVNESLPSISEERNNAISIYNSYFASEDTDVSQFLTDLQDNAIPDMEEYIYNLNAVETQTDEVAALKELYVQSVQAEYDAMKLVASAIEDENEEYLTQADELIDEASSLMSQYDSQLKSLAADNNISIN